MSGPSGNQIEIELVGYRYGARNFTFTASGAGCMVHKRAIAAVPDTECAVSVFPDFLNLAVGNDSDIRVVRSSGHFGRRDAA
jgi:hypothetical protein